MCVCVCVYVCVCVCSACRLTSRQRPKRARSGGARDVRRGAGRHTPSTASESVSFSVSRAKRKFDTTERLASTHFHTSFQH